MINSLKNLIKIEGGLSKKKIFRKTEKKINKIIIDFSEEKKDFYNFLDVYNILKGINISIPKIYEVYLNKYLIVMEDFGDETFDKSFHHNDFYNLTKIAIDNLIVIQNSLIVEDFSRLDKYSIYNLKSELSEFVDYYIPHKKIINFSKEYFYDYWDEIYNSQKFEFLSFVHKDYEFINLFFLSKNNNHLKCGIIDFQNAFKGFIGWDLFSILENPRIDYTRKYNEDLIKYFYDNVNIKTEYDTFRYQYYLLNLARLSRLLGRWIKLFKFEKNKEYLNYMNSTEKRIIACLKNIKDKKLLEIYNKVLK